MLDGPLELLGGNQNLAEDGIDSSLPTVEACCSNDSVLIVEQEPGMLVQRVEIHISRNTYFNRLFKTCLRSANEVFAHVCWAFVAFTMIRSIPSGVTGLTRPSNWPVAGL